MSQRVDSERLEKCLDRLLTELRQGRREDEWYKIALQEMQAILEPDTGQSGTAIERYGANDSIISLPDAEKEGDPSDPTSALPYLDPRRYVRPILIGEGGQGTVHEVTDRILGRRVALKALRPEHATTPRTVQRFLREARLMAQLAHSGVVAVSDLGRLPDGTPAYVMNRIRGQNLRDILVRRREAYRAGNLELAESFPRRRLLEVLVSACHIVGYAHSRGVIHRDLKPGNLMLGTYNEVLVLDWGIARIGGQLASDTGDGPVVLPDAGFEPTLVGMIKGTPSYMAPEQAQGDPLAQGPWTDVFALGMILYEILCGEPGRKHGASEDALRQARELDIEPPESRRRRENLHIQPIPPELERVCVRCLARDPAARYSDAEALALALREFLDGETRRALAEQRVAEAEHRLQRVRSLEEEIILAAREAQLLAEAVEPWMDLERKRLVWSKESRVAAARALKEDTLAEAFALYTRALGDDPDNARANQGLAQLNFEALLEAEYWGRVRDARRAAHQVKLHDDGRLTEALLGQGFVSLTTDPPGVPCWHHPLQLHDRQLTCREPVSLGPTPIRLSIPMGRHLFEFRQGKQGKSVVFPVIMRRQAEVVGQIQLYPSIPESFTLVPAGTFIYGGDRKAPGSPNRLEKYLEDFAISRFPITCAEYLEFLLDLFFRHPARARPHVPRVSGRSGVETLWPELEQGGFRIPRVDILGERWSKDMPVRCVARRDAEAYCLWRSELEGLPIRLPTEFEWEKAGRGADGRWFPWGDEFDATFCRMKDSRPGRPEPEPIGTFPTDCSPYGVRDMAGGVVEWVDGGFDAHGTLGIQKGGFWMGSEASCRLARRFGAYPDEPEPFAGFRIAFTPTW